ncbi:MAG: hypothetical protein OXG44_16945 [Gammaproteobacteria bacterium]|nr:hypothetical protein [Gammaproteobacteria bacterium]
MTDTRRSLADTGTLGDGLNVRNPPEDAELHRRVVFCLGLGGELQKALDASRPRGTDWLSESLWADLMCVGR